MWLTKGVEARQIIILINLIRHFSYILVLWGILFCIKHKHLVCIVRISNTQATKLIKTSIINLWMMMMMIECCHVWTNAYTQHSDCKEGHKYVHVHICYWNRYLSLKQRSREMVLWKVHTTSKCLYTCFSRQCTFYVLRNFHTIMLCFLYFLFS